MNTAATNKKRNVRSKGIKKKIRITLATAQIAGGIIIGGPPANPTDYLRTTFQGN